MFNRAWQLYIKRASIDSGDLESTKKLRNDYKSAIFSFFNNRLIFKKTKNNISKLIYDTFGPDPYLQSHGEFPENTALESLNNSDYVVNVLNHLREQHIDLIDYEWKTHHFAKTEFSRRMFKFLIQSSHYEKDKEFVDYCKTIDAITVETIEIHTQKIFSMIKWKFPKKRYPELRNVIKTKLATYSNAKSNIDAIDFSGSISATMFIKKYLSRSMAKKIGNYGLIIGGLFLATHAYNKHTEWGGMTTDFFQIHDYEKQQGRLDQAEKERIGNRDLGEKTNPYNTIPNFTDLGEKKAVSLVKMRNNRIENTERLFALMDKDNDGNYIFHDGKGITHIISESEKTQIFKNIEGADLWLLDNIIKDIYSNCGIRLYGELSKPLVSNIVSHPSTVSENQQLSENEIAVYLNRTLEGDMRDLTLLHELIHSFNVPSIFVAAREGKTDGMALTYYYRHTGKDYFSGIHPISQEATSDYSNLVIGNFIISYYIFDGPNNTEFSFDKDDPVITLANENNRENKKVLTSVLKQYLYEYLRDNPNKDINPLYLSAFYDVSRAKYILTKAHNEYIENNSVITEHYLRDYITPKMAESLMNLYQDTKLEYIKKHIDSLDCYNDPNGELKQYLDQEVLPHLFGGPIQLDPSTPYNNYVDPELLSQIKGQGIGGLLHGNFNTNTILDEISSFLIKHWYLIPIYLGLIFIALPNVALLVHALYSTKNSDLNDEFKNELQYYRNVNIAGTVGLLGLILVFNAFVYYKINTIQEKDQIRIQKEKIVSGINKSNTNDEMLVLLKELKENKTQEEELLQKELLNENNQNSLIGGSIILFIIGVGMRVGLIRKYQSQEFLQGNLQADIGDDGRYLIQREAIHALFSAANSKIWMGGTKAFGAIIMELLALMSSKFSTSDYNSYIKSTKERGEIGREEFISQLLEYYQDTKRRAKLQLRKKNTVEMHTDSISFSEYSKNPAEYRLRKHWTLNDPHSPTVPIYKSFRTSENNSKNNRLHFHLHYTDPSLWCIKEKSAESNIERNLNDTTRSIYLFFMRIIDIIVYLEALSEQGTQAIVLDVIHSPNAGLALHNIGTLIFKKGQKHIELKKLFETIFQSIMEYPIFLEGRSYRSLGANQSMFTITADGLFHRGTRATYTKGGEKK